MLGFNALAATQIPANNPAPPVGTIIASKFGTCSMISKAIVPCPANTLFNKKK